ncbi:RimK family alpha-L-glutamate ligase [Streptomyces sp. NPDC059002]|uniref:ATP-grasp domain-containing protein n=1 Tax=Streptomyces sp. NPDC059002 TaxID=3346690 RepID=UPI0036D1F34E
MRIGILGWDREETESVGLLHAGKERGHDVVLFTLDDIALTRTATGSEPTALGIPVRHFDVIVSRAELRPATFQADHERYSLLSEVPGVTVLDPAVTYLTTECKLQGLHRLAAAGLPVAPTRSCGSLADVTDALEEWGPLVLKPSFGYGGTDVERVFDVKADRAVIDRLFAAYPILVGQPYLPHPDGDVRITLVGDEPVLNCRRVPVGGDHWKANIMQGARSVPFEPTDELLDVSRRAARLMGISIAALDFLPSPDGYRIVEINNTPGWYFVDEEEQRRICHAVHRFLERTV